MHPVSAASMLPYDTLALADHAPKSRKVHYIHPTCLQPSLLNLLLLICAPYSLQLGPDNASVCWVASIL